MTSDAHKTYSQAEVDALVTEAVAKAVAEERKACARIARTAIENWGEDLLGTHDDYLTAIQTGRLNGRSISKDMATAFAKEYKHRGDSVYDSGEIVEAAILKPRPSDPAPVQAAQATA